MRQSCIFCRLKISLCSVKTWVLKSSKGEATVSLLASSPLVPLDPISTCALLCAPEDDVSRWQEAQSLWLPWVQLLGVDRRLEGRQCEPRYLSPRSPFLSRGLAVAAFSSLETELLFGGLVSQPRSHQVPAITLSSSTGRPHCFMLHFLALCR